ncbi:MAG: SGNH/GDSL hydrolase family protein [Nitrospira sp.]|nr:SGNH/GDSL hydrolase family protein [Nitrospira sp.]
MLFSFMVIGGLLLRYSLRPALRINAVLLLMALGTSLWTGELALAVLDDLTSVQKQMHWLPFQSGEDHADERATVAYTSAISFDRRSRVEVLSDLRTKGIDAWPAIPPQVLFGRQEASYQDPLIQIDGVQLLPLGGISSSTTVYCNENGYYVIYESDEHGFHNPKGLWSITPLDIAVIGDSYAHGACVKTDANFVSVIRQRYPATLNLGSDGNGPLLELATLKEYVPSLRPRVVLWCYFEMNDMGELFAEKRTFLTKYLTPGYMQGLVAKQTEIDRALKIHVERVMADLTPRTNMIMFLEHIFAPLSSLDAFEEAITLCHIRSRLATFQKPEGQRQTRRPMPARTHEELDLFAKALSEAKTTVAGWGGTLIFVYLPQYERYNNLKFVNKDRDQVLRIVRDLGLPLIDLHPTFEAQADPLKLFPFRRAGHYNETGHRVVAEEMLKFLGDMHLEPSKKKEPARSRHVMGTAS